MAGESPTTPFGLRHSQPTLVVGSAVSESKISAQSKPLAGLVGCNEPVQMDENC